jgi:hypothetical protein
MTTNKQRKFEKGDIISYAGDTFEVVENYGDTGLVKALMDGGIEVPFRWKFDGEESVLVKKECENSEVNSCEALQEIDGVPLFQMYDMVKKELFGKEKRMSEEVAFELNEELKMEGSDCRWFPKKVEG